MLSASCRDGNRSEKWINAGSTTLLATCVRIAIYVEILLSCIIRNENWPLIGNWRIYRRHVEFFFNELYIFRSLYIFQDGETEVWYKFSDFWSSERALSLTCQGDWINLVFQSLCFIQNLNDQMTKWVEGWGHELTESICKNPATVLILLKSVIKVQSGQLLKQNSKGHNWQLFVVLNGGSRPWCSGLWSIHNW